MERINKLKTKVLKQVPVGLPKNFKIKETLSKIHKHIPWLENKYKTR
jgi:hypothetical protein